MARLVVVDARCIVDLLYNGRRALEVLEVISGRSLAAPAHIDVDVVSLLARIDPLQVRAADTRMRVEVYLRMPVKRHDVSGLIREAWAHHPSLCVSDALYVALAEHLEAPLVTRSRAMADSSSRAILVQATRGWGGA